MTRREDLEKIFQDMPTIGPRQAKRIVYFLLYQKREYLENLSQKILAVKNDVRICQECNRFYEKRNLDNQKNICEICRLRGKSGKILILEKNQDFENIEKMNIWDGSYFLIGRNLKLTETEPKSKINLYPLIKKIQNNEIQEIVFALSLTPEGEMTKEWIYEEILPYQKKFNFKISSLGRGISVGTELEYSDKYTIISALENRK